MKELTIEEKAKAYDNLLERLKEMYNDNKTNIVSRLTYERYFSELKENKDEDERIKNCIGMCLIDADKQRFTDYNTSLKECLAWLKKQGELSVYNVPSREVILAIWELGNEWKELTDYSISTDYGTQLDYIQKHWEESEHYLKAKQGERKPTDTIEPKYHKGEWVINQLGYIRQIISIKDNSYYCNGNGNGYWTLPIEYADKYWHKWTINDAKDGDVLAISWWEDNDFWEKIVIFKKYNNKGVKGLYSMPCVEGYGNTFKNGKLLDENVPYYSKTWTCNLHPATKEQRDTLFAKMYEAGYTWDAEKKESKKIESKSAEWSEEDEKMLADACIMLDWYKGNNWWTAQHIKDWLKSLRPQEQWKPSDEQIKAFEHFVRSIGESGYASPYDNNTKLLYSLLEQLKKLKE